MIDQQLRQLAASNDGGDHYLTLYIDTKRADEAQKDRIRLFLKHESQKIREQISGNGHDDAVERGIRQIEDFITNSLQTDTQGLALFSCPTKNFFMPIQLPVPVEPALTIASRPQLRQLLQIRNDHPAVIIALVDAKTARLTRLVFNQLVQEIDIENPETPRKHDQGGWSQANIQRHVQDHIDRHHKEAADVLNRMVDAKSVKGLILAGQERNVSNFRSYLSKQAQDLWLGDLHLDIRSTAEEIVEASRKLIQQKNASTTQERLGVLQEARKTTGRGAAGAAEVADAVNQRKLQELFITHGAKLQGWKCSSCGIIGENVPLGCPACSASVVTIDLIEEFIAAAESEAAEVRFVESFPVLDRHQGVGALLRF